MAPTKTTRTLIPSVSLRGVTTRSKTHSTIHKDVGSKRKADGSPAKENAVKRSALGDISNAANKNKVLGIKNKVLSKTNVLAKKVTVKEKVLPSVRTIVKSRQNENLPPPAAPANKVQTRASLRHVAPAPTQTVQKPKENPKDIVVPTKVKTRLSNEFEKTSESLYCSALEDVNTAEKSTASSKFFSAQSSTEKSSSNITLMADRLEKNLKLDQVVVPKDVKDFDKENWDDVFQVSHYAMDIFNYLKTREAMFVIKDYMTSQPALSKWMRSLLVDWMVEIQESFELNHETLYLGVKLVDCYLSKITVGKETLQLVGAAAMFIASKYDERIPPLVEDFLYICDGAYTRRELIRMEINLLRVCDFDLGIPLSYRFLRRYARCCKVTMPVLTLARYILEYSLMDYDTVTLSDSKLAAACLYLALQMKKISGWTPTLEFYTGYTLEDIMPIVHILNEGLHRKPKEQTMTVRNKYSHEIFYEVAKVPLIKNEVLKS
nr:G2/mitotic-specific cyclin-B3 [Onthophagus taurus]